MGGTRAVRPSTLGVLDCTLGYNTSQASKKKKQQHQVFALQQCTYYIVEVLQLAKVRTLNCLVGVRTTENCLGQEAVTISQGSH